MTRAAIILSCLAGALLGHAVLDAAIAQAQQKQFVPGEIIVGYKSERDRTQAARELSRGVGAVRGRGISGVQVEAVGDTTVKLRIEVPATITRGTPGSADELSMLEDLAQQIKESDNRVRYAHPNWAMSVDPPDLQPPVDLKALDDTIQPQMAPEPGMPNDPAFTRGLHWHYLPPPGGMNAVAAWKLETGSTDVVVAVLDTGVLFDHPDLQGSGNLLRGRNFLTKEGRKGDATDTGDECPPLRPTSSWHGTHVAGTIGAVGSGNGKAIAGINWKVTVLPVRVLGRCGGSLTDTADAIRWAAGLPVKGMPLNDRPAHIINLSLGGNGICNFDNAGFLIDALEAVRKRGAVVVVAAGNENADISQKLPAGCKDVISVAANDKKGRLAYYSNYGNVTIMAPGGDTRGNDDSGLPPGVWSAVKVTTDNKHGMRPMQGTSMAAPHVSAAIALALAKHPQWRGKPDLIERKVRDAAVKTGPGSCRQPCGVGQLDAEKLLTSQ